MEEKNSSVRHTFVWMLLSLAAMCGCAGSSFPDPGPEGSPWGYEPGTSAFDIEAIPAPRFPGTGVEVCIRMNASTVSFAKAPGGFIAVFELSVRLRDRSSRDLIAEQIRPETLLVAGYDDTHSPASLRECVFLPAPPGAYELESTIEDMQNGSTKLHHQRVVVADLRDGHPELGKVILQSPEGRGAWEPVVAFHVAQGGDPLRAHALFYNSALHPRWTVEVLLVRFTSDTSEAVAPFLFGTETSKPEMRRNLPEQCDTVLCERRAVSGSIGDQEIAAGLPPLAGGMYRLSLRVEHPDEPGGRNDAGPEGGRYFCVMPAGFPRPVTLNEMVHAARYLMKPRERSFLDSANSVDERHRRFDEFWLSLVQDRVRAAGLLKTYFSRIEESNRLFSTFKEGWKTDRGMVFVILGPPERIERSYDRETWYYNHPGTYGENLWQFRRMRFAPGNLWVEDFALQRGVQYEVLWNRMLTNWRKGVVF